MKTTTYLKALTIFVLDGLVYQEGVITFFAAAVCGPKFLTALFQRNRADIKREGLFVMTVVMTFTFIIANNHMAHERTNHLIKVCNAYKEKYGDYPDSLSQLVPEYYDRVPRAKFGKWGKYYYYSSPDAHVIMYVVLPFWQEKLQPG